jgi:hypothetical protein
VTTFFPRSISRAVPVLHRNGVRTGGEQREGKTNPEIPLILGLSVRTSHHHLENIYAKLGVETRTAAAARALEADP